LSPHWGKKFWHSEGDHLMFINVLRTYGEFLMSMMSHSSYREKFEKILWEIHSASVCHGAHRDTGPTLARWVAITGLSISRE
jgi:hypothetical protein